jgi:hypothetical protein
MGPSPYPHVIAKVPAQLPAAVTPTPMSLREVILVSVDHFRHQLLAQMNRAAKAGSIDIVINSGQLYRSLGGYPGSMHGMPACCDAMRSEMKPGDILLVEQASGPGMTVRYRLPRPK